MLAGELFGRATNTTSETASLPIPTNFEPNAPPANAPSSPTSQTLPSTSLETRPPSEQPETSTSSGQLWSSNNQLSEEMQPMLQNSEGEESQNVQERGFGEETDPFASLPEVNMDVWLSFFFRPSNSDDSNNTDSIPRGLPVSWQVSPKLLRLTLFIVYRRD
jgi:hypothetical protein